MGTIASFMRNLVFAGSYTKALDLTTPTETIDVIRSQSYTDGTTANKAGAFWSDTASLAATSVNIDIAGGITDAFGDTVTFTKVREILIYNTSTTATEILNLTGTFMDVLTGGTANVPLGPNGIFHMASPVDGFAVGAGSSDVITIDSNADTITYGIAILGTV